MVKVTNHEPRITPARQPVRRQFSGGNHELFNEAKRYIAGGVNSPVRSFRAVGLAPIFIKRGHGSKVYSEDGREFIDYCLGWGSLILGHADTKVAQELKKMIDNGTNFGAPTKAETKIARAIAEAIPSMEKIRLTNSGTEAVMGAIRVARAFTKKDKIIKFAGSYHGHADYLLDCEGVPEDFRKDTVTSSYNDIKAIEAMVRKFQKDTAAIIVEPVAANMGVVLPNDGFLETLRKMADNYGILLIFDEVITAFRLTYGGAQKVFNIKPDLTCLGKVIGGGLPVGAFGGRGDIMKLLAPEGSVYQAGTFSGNPVIVSAGIVTLKILRKIKPYAALEERNRFLCQGIVARAKKHGAKIKINYIGSLFGLFFIDREVADYRRAKSADMELFKKFYHLLLEKGVYLSPSSLEANFLSTAHTKEDVNETLEAADKTFYTLGRK